MPTPLQGIFAAAVTPLTQDLELDLNAVPSLLDFLASRGCHGVLMLGTTGEGPSFSLSERMALLRETLRHRDQALPELRVLAGTGCANLAETIELTRAAFDMGADGVVALPAFFYKAVSAEGIADYFERLVEAAVPADGPLLVYHIPQVSGVPIADASLARLRARFPQRVWGMKDSQDDLAHTLATLEAHPGLVLFCGSDSIQSEALAGGAAGAITALANVTTPLNLAVWDAHCQGQAAPGAQQRLVRARQAVKGLNGPAAMKAALADLFGFPLWPVRAPLTALAPEAREKLSAALRDILGES